jgi:hypothetical protein
MVTCECIEKGAFMLVCGTSSLFKDGCGFGESGCGIKGALSELKTRPTKMGCFI